MLAQRFSARIKALSDDELGQLLEQLMAPLGGFPAELLTRPPLPQTQPAALGAAPQRRSSVPAAAEALPEAAPAVEEAADESGFEEEPDATDSLMQQFQRRLAEAQALDAAGTLVRAADEPASNQKIFRVAKVMGVGAGVASAVALVLRLQPEPARGQPGGEVQGSVGTPAGGTALPQPGPLDTRRPWFAGLWPLGRKGGGAPAAPAVDAQAVPTPPGAPQAVNGSSSGEVPPIPPPFLGSSQGAAPAAGGGVLWRRRDEGQQRDDASAATEAAAAASPAAGGDLWRMPLAELRGGGGNGPAEAAAPLHRTEPPASGDETARRETAPPVQAPARRPNSVLDNAEPEGFAETAHRRRQRANL
jgi:hypothetical protein